jgi:hypothetical protein
MIATMATSKTSADRLGSSAERPSERWQIATPAEPLDRYGWTAG